MLDRQLYIAHETPARLKAAHTGFFFHHMVCPDLNSCTLARIEHTVQTVRTDLSV